MRRIKNRTSSPASSPASARSSGEDEHAGQAGGNAPDMERPFAELMGIEIRFAPDELAPPVDGDKLARYLCEALSPDETAEVCHLIGTFRCWYDACATLCRRGVNK